MSKVNTEAFIAFLAIVCQQKKQNAKNNNT